MLAQEDIEFIKSQLPAWLAELSKPPLAYELEARERLVLVEEELKHQRELVRQGFEQIDRRFAELHEDINRRFEATDKHFEAIDKRFETVDKRFEVLTKRLDRLLLWSFGLYVTGICAVLAALWHFLG